MLLENLVLTKDLKTIKDKKVGFNGDEALPVRMFLKYIFYWVCF